MSFNFFLILIPIYSFSLFLPTIIESMGYDSLVRIQLFTVPPNFLAFLVVIASSIISDKIKMRGPCIVVGFSVALIGYIMQIASSQSAVKYAGTFFIAAGAFPCSPLIVAWLSNNLAPHYTKATGLGFIVAVGNCGAFVATFTYVEDDAPKYTVRYTRQIDRHIRQQMLRSTPLAEGPRHQHWRHRPNADWSCDQHVLHQVGECCKSAR